MLDTITPLKDQWFELYSEFEPYRDAILASIVKWEWANGPRYDPRPYYFQRGTTKGNLLRRKSPSERDDWVWQCGYNEQGHCVLARSSDGGETLYTFHEEYIEMTRYQIYYQLLRGVSRLYFDALKPAYFLSFGLQGNPTQFSDDTSQVWQDALNGKFNIHVEREDYIFLGQQLQSIQHKIWDKVVHPQKEERIWTSEDWLNYRPNGDLDHVIRYVPSRDRTWMVYRKRKKGETLKSITEAAKSRLIRIIPELIAEQKFSEPLYCVQLRYMDESFFPPNIFPGFETDRQRNLEMPDAHRRRLRIWYYIWDFEEHEDEPYPPYPIEDQDTLKACEILQIEINMGSRFQHGRRTLYQVAKTLNQLDWSKYAPVTSDFIVYAIDEDDLHRTLRSSGATNEQIQDWNRRNLL